MNAFKTSIKQLHNTAFKSGKKDVNHLSSRKKQWEYLIKQKNKLNMTNARKQQI